MGENCGGGDSYCRDTIGSIMTIDCPVCAGTGQAPKHNGVDPQKGIELHECWMCKGHGKVEEVKHDTKIHIVKYHGVMAG